MSLEAKIPLGDVSGRIDHLAIDLERSRLFVAELGNDSLGVVDLAAGTARVVPGFQEPQGLAYFPEVDRLYAADGVGGTLHILEGEGLSEVASLPLGDDADNVRVDRSGNRVVVGHGDGAFAVIDAGSAEQVGDIQLPAHPESFQIDRETGRAFVNLPDVGAIAAVDLQHGEIVSRWQPADGGNFPMALDAARQELTVGFRAPAAIATYASADGSLRNRQPACEDSDDLFIDAGRDRLYVICGGGEIEVFSAGPQGFRPTAHVPTAPGARTGLFVPELDRLFVAVPASDGEPAAVWVFKPT